MVSPVASTCISGQGQSLTKEKGQSIIFHKGFPCALQIEKCKEKGPGSNGISDPSVLTTVGPFVVLFCFLL